MKNNHIASIILLIGVISNYSCQKENLSNHKQIDQNAFKNTQIKNAILVDKNNQYVKNLLTSQQMRNLYDENFFGNLNLDEIWFVTYKNRPDVFSIQIPTSNTNRTSSTEKITALISVGYFSSKKQVPFMNKLLLKFDGLGRISTRIDEVLTLNRMRMAYVAKSLQNSITESESSYFANARIAPADSRDYCFDTFSSCVNWTYNNLTKDNLGKTECEWLPCRTMSDASCAIAYTDGTIQNSSISSFIGTANCNGGVIISAP